MTGSWVYKGTRVTETLPSSTPKFYFLLMYIYTILFFIVWKICFILYQKTQVLTIFSLVIFRLRRNYARLTGNIIYSLKVICFKNKITNMYLRGNKTEKRKISYMFLNVILSEFALLPFKLHERQIRQSWEGQSKLRLKT